MADNSSLDPLGPEFGKTNSQAINSKSLSAFEGDALKDNKPYFPVTPPLASTHPNYIIQDGLTGYSPNLPSGSNPKAGVSTQDRLKAITENFKMASDANLDKSSYTRINSYNAGPSGNSFYKRYAAYGQKKFDEIGFSPLRDNEAMFNAKTTMGDDFSRMMKNSFVPLFSRGFVAGPKSLVKMMQGDFSADLEDARAYENAAAIGQSSKKGLGAFFNNTAMSFGYTAGIISEAILEEAAGALLAPLTGGGSFFAVTANNARKIGKIGNGLDLAMDGYKAVNTTLKEANTINGARKMWKNAETLGKNKLFNFINPLENTYEAAMNIGKNADNLTGLARLAQSTSKTAGGLFRDIRNINMALSEARLEGGMTDNKIYDEAYNAFYKKNKRSPTNEEQYEMTKMAKEAGMNTLVWNTALIFGSNKIVIPNLLKSGTSKSALKSKIDDVLELRDGKIVLEKTTKVGKKVAEGEFKYVENSLKNSLSGLKKAPVKTVAKVSGRYLKGNLMEGVQENLQDVIAGANEEYYLTAYKNKELGAHLYERAQSSLRYDKLGDQFSAQGFETFASGALMGVFSGGLNMAKRGLDYTYNNTINKKQYQEYKEKRKTHGQDVAKRLTDLYKDPKEFFNARIFNYGVQNNTVSNVEEADTKEGKDQLSEAFINQVTTALDTNTLNYFKEHISSFKDLSVDEFEEAFGFEKGTGAKAQQKIDRVLNNIDSIEKSHAYAKERFPNPFDTEGLDKNSPEYTEQALNYQAWEHAKNNYVFANHSFMNVAKRMNDISGTILNNPSMEKMSQTDMNVLFKPAKITEEIVVLKSEIENLKNSTDPLSREQLTQKENKLKALATFSETYKAYDLYNNRNKYGKEVIKQYKEQNGLEELSKEETNAILDATFGEQNDKATRQISSTLELSYKNYIKVANAMNSDYIFDTDIDQSFNKLKDYYKLNAESKALTEHINFLHNPQAYVNFTAKTKEWMTKMYEERESYYVDLVNKQMAAKENNTVLNELANMNIFIDLDAFQNYMENDILPDEFFNETTKEPILKGSDEYKQYLNILTLAKRVRAEDVTEPSLEGQLKEEIDILNAKEQEELEALPKKETITQIKHEIAKDKPFTIQEAIEDVDERQYIKLKYAGSEETITIYLGFDAYKLNDSKGDVVDIETIKDKFSEYVIYKKVTKADPEAVKAITDKYDKLREAAANKTANKKVKADIYSNYTPVKELPKALYKELQDAFVQTDEAIAAEESEPTKEEFMDLFKVFVRNNPIAADIIEAYNTKSKDAADQENLGNIDDFTFILNNKNLKTANYSNDDIKIFIEDFQKLIDESDNALAKASYQTTIDKLNRLLSTRDIASFTPEVQEIINTLKTKLIAKQGDVRKIQDSGYIVNGTILDRVTNFIQNFKTDKFSYPGEKDVKNVFEITIGAGGLTNSVVKSFIKKLKAEIHVNSTTKNLGYTDDTEAALEDYFKNVLAKDKNDPIFKNKDLQLKEILGIISENSYEASRVAGNYIDAQLREFFTKGKSPIFNNKKITREAYDSLFGPDSFLKPIKQRIDSGELFTLAQSLKVYDVETGIAGEMDLLLIDKEGKLQIIDFKTGTEIKWDGFVTETEAGLNKTEDYTLQQYTYARLLKKMTGLDANINIFPIETELDQNGKIILKAGEPSNKKLTGLGNWYFKLNPEFNNVKSKIDNAISIQDPSIKVATEVKLTQENKRKLGILGYKTSFIKELTKEQLQDILKNGIPFEKFNSATASSMSFGTTDVKSDIEKERKEKLNSELRTLEDQLNSVTGNTPMDKVAKVALALMKGNIQNSIKSIKAELNSAAPVKIPDSLKDLVKPIFIHGKEQTIFTTKSLDRDVVFVEIDGKRYGFYQSTNGTDNKTKNHWYPFYGKAQGWVVKDGGGKNWKYNSQASPELQVKLEDAANKLNAEYGNKQFENTPYIHDTSENETNNLIGSHVKDSKQDLLNNNKEEYNRIKKKTADEGFKNTNEPSLSDKEALRDQVRALPDDMIYGLHVTGDDVAKNIYDTQFTFNLGTSLSGTVGVGSKESLYNALLKLQKGESPHRGQLGMFIVAFPKSEFGESTTEKRVSLESIEDQMLETYDEFRLGRIPTKFNYGYFSHGKLYTKNDVLASNNVLIQATKASELNFQKGDTVIVKEPIKDFADVGSTLTVLKSDEKSVSFTYDNKEKTLTLQELNKYITTMDIEKNNELEQTSEILDTLDKQVITESRNAFDEFMNKPEAIKQAMDQADATDISTLKDDLLNDLDC